MTPYELRLQLLQAGYAPLPLKGKRPVFDNWPARDNTNPDEVRRWAIMWPGAQNTGVLTKLTPALDIDILDPEAAEAIEQLARDRFGEHGTVLPRVGQAPKRAILFRTTVPFSKITANLTAANGSEQKIEFLCDGQQVVVDGIHPTTREPYRWPQGCIGDVRHDDLPLIDAYEARQLVDDIVTLLTVEYGYRSQGAKAKTEAGNGAGSTDWGGFANLIDHDVLAAFAMKLLKSGCILAPPSTCSRPGSRSLKASIRRANNGASTRSWTS